LFACSLYGGAKSSHAQKWFSLSEETPNPEDPEGLAYEVELDSPRHAQLVRQSVQDLCLSDERRIS
jgi:hypothetical protein